MNGFANTILSFLLSWIRALIYNIWAVVNSEGGGALYRFLAQHWLTILLVLGAGGFIADRIIYFIRWRPYYVWASCWDRMRRPQKKLVHPEPEPLPQESAVQEWDEPDAPFYGATMAYQPSYGQQPAQTQFYAPVKEAEPVFDEPAPQWDEPEQWQQQTLVDFGRPRPEPIQYYRDVQAGFAPAVAPEHLYAPRQRSADMEQTAVHPGLDEETFRQSFGLEQQPPQPVPVMHAPAFRPFTAARDDEVAPARAQSALSRLARRARTLVGDTDDDHPLTIRDLHSTVDVSQAFHEPVYPQRMTAMDDDR